MIIWLASYPRSGNRFTNGILRNYFQLKVISLYQHVQQAKKYLKHPETSAGQIVIIKTHELPADDPSPALYIVRDGRDSYTSYAHFELDQKELRKPLPPAQSVRMRMDYYLSRMLKTNNGLRLRGFRDAWIIRNRKQPTTVEDVRNVLQHMIPSEGYYGGWSNHILQWTARSAPTSILRFEDLITADDPTLIIQHALQQLGVEAPIYKKYQKASIEDLRKAMPHLVRRGKVGSHRDEFTEELEELFWQHHAEGMKKLNYSR